MQTFIRLIIEFLKFLDRALLLIDLILLIDVLITIDFQEVVNTLLILLLLLLYLIFKVEVRVYFDNLLSHDFSDRFF